MMLTNSWEKNYVEKINKIFALHEQIFLKQYFLYARLFYFFKIPQFFTFLTWKNFYIFSYLFYKNIITVKKKPKLIKKNLNWYLLIKEKILLTEKNLFLKKRFHFTKELAVKFRKKKKKFYFLKYKYTKNTFFFKKKKFFKNYAYNFLKFSFIKNKQTNKHFFASSFSLLARNFFTYNFVKNSLHNNLYKFNKFSFLRKQKKTSTYNTNALNLINNKENSEITFFNTYKKFSWKLRLSRFVHWNLKKRGTLNEYRYNKFLNTELKNKFLNKPKQMLIHIIYKTYLFLMTWKQSIFFLKEYSFLLNGVWSNSESFIQWGDILELPFGFGLTYFNKNNSKYFNKIVKRAKKYSYKTYLKATKQNKYIRSNTKIIKIYKKLPLASKQLGIVAGVDYIFNIFGFLKKNVFDTNDLRAPTHKLSVLTLQNWRYRFD